MAEAHQAGLIIRKPYDKDLYQARHLIENFFAKLKQWLRAKAARSLEVLETELGPALATITTQDAQGWFRLCGYVTPN